MEIERKRDTSDALQVVVPEREFQRAVQVAQVALQLRGDSKERPETFLDDALKLINEAWDRIEPKPDAIAAAYDECLRTGRKDDLARFFELREESLQVPTALLFFSGSTEHKPVNRIGLAVSGAVMWRPEAEFLNYSPEFGEWQPIEIGNFFYKGLLERCHEAFIREYPNSKMSLKTYRAKWRELIESGANISEGLFLFLYSIRYPDAYEAYKKAANWQLTPSENGCKEIRQKAAREKRKSPPRNKDGRFTKRKP